MNVIARLAAWRFDTVGARAGLALIALLIVAQLITLGVYYILVMQPQSERLAALMAQNVSAIAQTMSRLSPDEQAKFVARLSRSPYLRIHEDVRTWPEEAATPTMLESMFLSTLAKKLEKDAQFEWRTGGEGRIWLAMTFAGKRYWLSTRAPDEWRPGWAFALTAAVSLILSTAAGLLLQRRFGQSLRFLSAAAQRVSLSSSPEPVPAQGPREIRDLGQSFNRMTERLAAAERERNLMLAGVSHDLRTPLAKIRLAVEMLAPDKPADDLKTTIVRQIETMDAMLAQFLDFARGLDQEGFATISPAALIADVIDRVGDANATAAPAPATLIRAKPLALQRAVANLVTNALKYGKPPVIVETVVTSDECVIAVRDHGPGLSAEERARLVEPFARGDAARGDQGSGLGLAIANRVAQAHGGRLELEAADGGGLRAVLRLPLA